MRLLFQGTIVAMLVFAAIFPLYAQDEPDSATTCFYHCTNVKDEILSRCLKPSLSDLARLKDDVLPYTVFDSLVRVLLRQGGSQNLDLEYSFKACDFVCNAAALTDHHKRKVILYSPLFMNSIRVTGDRKRWAALGIFAHEIGHHIMGHTEKKFDVNGRRTNETRADFFAGYLISLFPGATLRDAFEGLRTLDSLTYRPRTDVEEKSSKYPTLATRFEAIRTGFEHKLTSENGIAVFRDIKAYAVKNKLGVIYRTMDFAFKAGHLSQFENEISEFLILKNLTLDQLATNGEAMRELEKVIKNETGVKLKITEKDGDLNIRFKEKDLQGLIKPQSEEP